jgi:AcrR family transcriptional regulator
MPARKRTSSVTSPEPVAAGTERDRPVGRAGTPAQGRELRARGQRTMRRLLDAGITVFATRGYHSARVDDIVKAAKTSHGTFYLYFANKEDLFQALVGDVATELNELTASLGPLGPGEAGQAELRAWLERFAAMYEHYGPVIRTWTEAELDSSEAGRIGTDVLGDLTAALAERIDAAASDVDPQLAAMAAVAMIERFNYFVLSRQVAANQDEMLDTLAGVVHRALFGQT